MEIQNSSSRIEKCVMSETFLTQEKKVLISKCQCNVLCFFSINVLVFYCECRSLIGLTLLAIYSVIDSEKRSSTLVDKMLPLLGVSIVSVKWI